MYLDPEAKTASTELLKEVAVTIAAGFKGAEGIVIGADSQETISGFIKLEQRKVHVALMHQNRALAIAGAGTSDYIEAAVEKIMGNFPHTDILSEAQEVLEEILIGFFDKHLARWSSFGEHDRPSVELLIGLSLKHQCGLFHYTGTVLNAVEKKAIGAGILLANELIRENYRDHHECKKLAKTAAYILWKVKKNVDTCGGFTDLVLMKENGMVASIDSSTTEKLEKEFVRMEEESASRLLMEIQSQNLPDFMWHNREGVLAMHDSKKEKKEKKQKN